MFNLRRCNHPVFQVNNDRKLTKSKEKRIKRNAPAICIRPMAGDSEDKAGLKCWDLPSDKSRQCRAEMHSHINSN